MTHERHDSGIREMGGNGFRELLRVMREEVMKEEMTAFWEAGTYKRTDAPEGVGVSGQTWRRNPGSVCSPEEPPEADANDQYVGVAESGVDTPLREIGIFPNRWLCIRFLAWMALEKRYLTMEEYETDSAIFMTHWHHL